MKYLFIICLLGCVIFKINAQGPPITNDKPIMLGGNSYTIATLTEIRNNDRGTAVYVPIVGHYLPTSNTLIGVHLPFISYDLNDAGSGSALADVKLLGKYQFYRKDGTGRTFRMVVKTIQNLPTGKTLDLLELSTGVYQGYYGVVSGYETLKYGISTELGYNWAPDGTQDELRAKFGVGLPLLKPQYPNKQLNLYFEYTSSWLTERNWYQLLYAQGIQYALKKITFDLAVQLPLIKDIPENRALNYSIFLGSRYTF